MKINTYQVILLLFLNTYSLSGQEKTTFQCDTEKKLNIGLLGKVKTISILTTFSNGNIDEDLYYIFDKNGIATEVIGNGLGIDIKNKKLREVAIHYNFKDGKLISKLNKMSNGLDGEIYEYDNHWNLVNEKDYIDNILIKEIAKRFDTINRLQEKVEYLYGAYSNYDEKSQTNKANYINDKETYKYDKKNNLILIISEDIKRGSTQKTYYKYDTNNNRIEEGSCVIFNSDSNCVFKPHFGYKYDNKGRLIKKIELGQFHPHNTDDIYNYNKKGYKTRVIGYYYTFPNNDYKVGYQYNYKFNKFGNMTEESEIIGDYRRIDFDSYKKKTIKYDNLQNIVIEEYLNEYSTPIRVIVNKYEYDKNGNWTKKEILKGTSFDSLKTFQISTRKIEYYE